MIVVATQEEYNKVKHIFKEHQIIKTGVGGINVVKSLKDIPLDTEIINFGYVGSNVLPINTIVEVGEVFLYHPNVNYKEHCFKIDGKVKCFTSSDFVLSTQIKEPCVFDMELAFILAMGFKKVKSYKIVSDNLSIKEYKENING